MVPYPDRLFCSVFGIDDAIIIGAALSATSSVASGAMAAGAQEDANSANTAMSREQMEFQERMSSTAHQREVADLKAAGLNPILSTRLGGASSPGGSMPNIIPVDGLARGIERAGSTATQAVLQDAALKNTQANTAKTQADAVASVEHARLMHAQRFQVNADTERTMNYVDQQKTRLEAELRQITENTNLTVQQRRNAAVDFIVKNYQVSSAKAAAAVANIDDKFFRSGVGSAARWAELLSDAILPTANSAQGVRNVFKSSGGN